MRQASVLLRSRHSYAWSMWACSASWSGCGWLILGFINPTVRIFDLDRARDRRPVAHSPHTSVVTSLLSAEAELSRTPIVVVILVVGLLGCAREAEHDLGSIRSSTLDPVVVAQVTPNDSPPPAGIQSDPRATLIADFAASIAERTRCGQRPERCAIEAITARNSEYRSFLTRLMTERQEAGFRTLPGVGEFRYRIESIEMTDGRRAIVHTCSLDSVVLFDLGHSNDATESTRRIIVDDAVVSARTRWELALDAGRWKWVSARGTELNMEEDLCGFDVD